MIRSFSLRLGIFLTLWSLHEPVAAQHCPFDGAAAVIIRLPLTQENLSADTSVRFFLVETDTLLADSCTYAKGALHIRFRSIDDALVKKYPNSWEYRAELYTKEAPFNQPGLLAVVLNQAEASCMLNRNNQFTYIKRKFGLQVFKDQQLIRQIPVPMEKIYSLCTSAGSWSRIQPIEISLAD